MTRTRLIDQIFTSLGLDYHKVTTKNTPAENDVIFKKNLDGFPYQEISWYTIVVEMI